MRSDVMASELVAAQAAWWADGAEGEELWARWACWCVEGVGAVRMARLHRVSGGSFAALWRDAGLRRRALAGMGASAGVARGLSERWAEGVEASWERALTQGSSPLFVGSCGYPEALRELEDAPSFVCVSGTLEGGTRRLAMVGSREVEARWVVWAREQATRLGGSGVCVVSGGALGIDGAVHEGALAAGAPTVAVMPGGLRELAPRSHRALFERVEGCGALVSEYPPWVAVRKHHYARRNRLIAALGAGCVVVRAREGSGALYTAQAALGLGRGVGAVPFEVGDEGGAGGVGLLASGVAVAVRGAQDMGRLCGVSLACVATQVGEGPGGRAGRVWEAMRGASGVCGAEEVACGVGMGVGEVLAELLELELGGWVERVAGQAAWRVKGVS
jgi:DNA processing protein